MYASVFGGVSSVLSSSFPSLSRRVWRQIPMPPLPETQLHVGVSSSVEVGPETEGGSGASVSTSRVRIGEGAEVFPARSVCIAFMRCVPWEREMSAVKVSLAETVADAPGISVSPS